LDYIKFLVSCFQAYYPESLGVCLVHNAPFIFSGAVVWISACCFTNVLVAGVWRLIRPLLDPVVASKIHFVSNVSEMEQFIAKDQIVSALGGDDPWEYTYSPPTEADRLTHEPEDKREALLAQREAQKTLEKATLEWCLALTADGADQAAINAEFDQKRRDGKVQLSDTFRRADAFLRQPTHYHRIGDIKL
jgi:hypothetical protein